MNRLNNGHIINTIQTVKPLRKKIALNLVLTFVMVNMRVDSSEDNNIVVYKISRVRIFSEDWVHSLLPSIFMLAMAVITLCHLGWKMTFMIILLAPMPAIINKMRTAKHEKHKIISLIKPNPVLPHRSPKSEVRSWKLEIRNPKSATKPQANSAKPIRNLK